MPPEHSPQTRCLPKCLFPGTYFENTDLKSQNTHTCGFRPSHNTGYNSTVAFQGHQAESGDAASPSTRPLRALPASPKRSQSAGTGSSRRHWVLDDGMFSPFITSSSISTPTTLPVALPGIAQAMKGHTGPGRKCQLIECRKKVEETGQVTVCPSLECPPRL